MNKNITRIISGIETAKYGCNELLSALMNKKIIQSPESIRIAIEDYFDILDEVLEQSKILHELSADNRQIKKNDIIDIISSVKGLYEKGIDICYQAIELVKPIIEKEIFKKEVVKTEKEIAKEKFIAECNLQTYKPEKSKKEVLSPTVIKNSIKYKKSLTIDLLFVNKLLNTKEQQIPNIKYETIIQKGQMDSKKLTSEYNTGVGNAERFAKGN